MSEESLTADTTSVTDTTSKTTAAASTSAKTTSATVVNDVTAATTESQIYVGPNIASERLNRFAVFKNGLPTHMEDTFIACPAVKKLFVTVDQLSSVLDKVNKTGTSYNAWYNQVTAYLQKGVK